MSSAGKFTSIYDVIERVHRAGFRDFTEEEAKEWTWEAIMKLGIQKHLIDRTAIIPIDAARGTLPYDLCDITSGGVRDYQTKICLMQEKDLYYNPDTVGESTITQSFNTEYPSVVYVDGVQIDDTNVFLSQVPYYEYIQQEFTYKLDNGFIYTGFKTGNVEIAYKAFPIDNEGNPMIEDDVKVVYFVEMYIIKRIANRMWLMEELTTEKLRKIEQDYAFAAGAARSTANIGSVEDWESIRARMLRLNRDPNLARIGFKNYSTREGLKL